VVGPLEQQMYGSSGGLSKFADLGTLVFSPGPGTAVYRVGGAATGLTATVQPSPSDNVDAARSAARFTLTSEHLAWLFVLLLAAGFRLLSLSATPLGTTEGSHALGTWLAEQGRAPTGWSGSLTDALTAVVFKLFGAGDAGARVVPALAGVALVLAFWTWRGQIGRSAALLAALLAALSPVLV